MIVCESFKCGCVSFKKSFKSVLVSSVGLVIWRVSMMGVYEVAGESVLMGDRVMSKVGCVVGVGFEGRGLAAVCCVGVLGGAGLRCFLRLFRLRSRSWRS